METEFFEVSWSEELETGIDVLDEQHHQYFDLLSDYLGKAAKVAQSSVSPENILELAETLNFLRNYAQEHFSTEESVMKEAAYADFDAHQEEHLHFLKHVEELYNQMKTDGYHSKLALEVHYYIVEWFIEHIRVSDMKFVEHLKQKSTEDKKLTIFLKKIYQSLHR